MTDQERIDLVAKAICEAWECDAENNGELAGHKWRWHDYAELAEIAIDAYKQGNAMKNTYDEEISAMSVLYHRYADRVKELTDKISEVDEERNIARANAEALNKVIELLMCEGK